MVTSRNKSKKYSTSYHTTRSRVPERQNNFAKKTILIVILVATLTVVTAVICTFFLNPKTRVENEISALAAEYYEDYFYDNLTHSIQFKTNNNLDSTMEKYHKYGLAPITLSDLLLYNNEKNADHRDFLTKYCDENTTYIKFYPFSPYNKQDYRTEIDYACTFQQ